MALKVLFAASEAYPLIKTGGLADVAYGLPIALHAERADVRLLLPAYYDMMGKLKDVYSLGSLQIQGAGRMHEVHILEGSHEAFPFPIWVVECGALFGRSGNPYMHPDGYDWPDNAERFTVFSRAAALLADDALKLNWRPDAVHAHDWQTGLIPALLEEVQPRPQSVFTIHNLAYGGHFSHAVYDQLQLAWHWWSSEGVEFYGGFSMLKAGIAYADAVTTVSPTYAQEICTPEFGYGLDGFLRSRSYKLHGILNGIDTEIWNPKNDDYLVERYGLRDVRKGKLANKQALLERFGQTPTEEQLARPLLGMVSRLVEQKGVDMVMECIHPLLAETNAAFVLIGSGHHHYEQALYDLAARYPGRVMVYIGYNEGLAHLLEAGCDIFLMPSRFEPCGLNQMYSLNYGTLPIVYNTGGLADTVINATAENIAADTANGFVFYLPFSHALLGTLWWVLRLFAEDPKLWRALQRNALKADFAWKRSAQRYIELYRNK